MEKFPIRGVPRWMEFSILAIDFLIKSIPIIIVLGISVLLAAQIARSDAGTLPERKADLCTFLGYVPNCKLKYQYGKFGRATMEIGVDESVGDPDGDPAVTTKAATLRVTVNVMNNTELEEPVVMSQVFQRVVTEGVWGWWWVGLQAPPCITAFQVAHSVDDAYSCLTEEQLVGDVPHMETMIPYSRGDWPLLDQLRTLHGATGVPVPIAILSGTRTFDHRTDVLPSTFEAEVIYAFVVPAPGWVSPTH